MEKRNTKYIFVIGGVLSSLGKGITASSMGLLLKSRNFKVKNKKLDPYLNIDPGTMNPQEHGEVFVTEDGLETDLDLGYYERFTQNSCNKNSNITGGAIYESIIKEERAGKYLGKTVQIIPHVSNKIEEFITKDDGEYDFIICEIGGTLGDLEIHPFLQACKQMNLKLGSKRNLISFITYIPLMRESGELKTKPSQEAIKKLFYFGMSADIMFCRSEEKLSKESINKIMTHCMIEPSRIFEAIKVENVYEIPLKYEEQNLTQSILSHFDLNIKDYPLQQIFQDWKNFTLTKLFRNLNITLISKYKNRDSYKSLIEALKHSAVKQNVLLDIKVIDSENIKTIEDAKNILQSTDGVVVPGGFGLNGIKGKILSIQFARENKIPFIGICLGMQLAVIEFCRNVLGMKNASSLEFDANLKKEDQVVKIITEIIKDNKILNIDSDIMGGNMRLGNFTTKINSNSLASKVYQKEKIEERHRHRYEIANHLQDDLKKHNAMFSGFCENNIFPEIFEIYNEEKDTHPFFIATQFHPEFKSRPLETSPLFDCFIEESAKYRKKRK